MARGARCLALLWACLFGLAGGALGWGSCTQPYCSDCPSSPGVCKECRGELIGGTNEVMFGLFAARDGRCQLCNQKTDQCRLCNGRTGACTQCNDGFGLLAAKGRQPRCVKCRLADCISCAPDATKCQWCSGGRGVDLATGKCVQCQDTNCEADSCGSDASKCYYCKEGYKLAGPAPSKCIKQVKKPKA